MNAAQSMPGGVELAWLLAGLVAAPRIAVRDLVADSHEVQPGDAFVALAGRTTHGLDHLDEAVARGAIAVLWDPTDGRSLPPLPPAVTAVSVPGLRPELGDVAAQVTGSAVEVASLGDAFGVAVRLFGESNDRLMAHLQRIEAALDKSLMRSDEQLAYYVAQAREVIDLSMLSQKQIVENLQQLASQRATAGADAA